MYTTTELKLLAEHYVAASRNSHFTVSEQICGRSNNRVIWRLLEGLGISSRNAEKVSNFFDERWPEDLPWPEGITRNHKCRV